VDIREWLFEFLTNPPCKRDDCEYWEEDGNYCFLKDTYPEAKRCPYIDKFIPLQECE